MIFCECYYFKILNQNSAEGNGMVKQIEQFLKRKYDDFIRWTCNGMLSPNLLQFLGAGLTFAFRKKIFLTSIY